MYNVLTIPEDKYKRAITHTEYRFMSKAAEKVGIMNLMDKMISTSSIFEPKKRTGSKDEVITFIDDQYMVFDPDTSVLPIWGGGAFFLCFFAFFIPMLVMDNDESVTVFQIIALVITFLGFVFFLIYYFTMPKKENIYNRKEGLVTFPGFMWHKNITMDIFTVAFTYSQPSAQGIGGYQLQLTRPDKMFTPYKISFGKPSHEDLSFYLWYMDKNRPLPPGTAFDPYRDQDFERRKAAGFPMPMFPSNFETPEATPEQQAERKRIGGW